MSGTQPMGEAGGGSSGRVLVADELRGVPGVLVSDGLQVVRTDDDGRYRLSEIPQRVKFVWVTVPAGYRTERFYRPVAEDGAGDFVLERWEATAGESFSFLQISDSETSEDGSWLEEILRYDMERLAEGVVPSIPRGALLPAGAMAALSAGQRRPPRELPMTDVRSLLRAHGAIVPEEG